jgi:hypothetical protein
MCVFVRACVCFWFLVLLPLGLDLRCNKLAIMKPGNVMQNFITKRELEAHENYNPSAMKRELVAPRKELIIPRLPQREVQLGS